MDELKKAKIIEESVKLAAECINSAPADIDKQYRNGVLNAGDFEWYLEEIDGKPIS